MRQHLWLDCSLRCCEDDYRAWEKKLLKFSFDLTSWRHKWVPLWPVSATHLNSELHVPDDFVQSWMPTDVRSVTFRSTLEMLRPGNRWCEVMCCVLTKDSPRTLMQPPPGERKYQHGVSSDNHLAHPVFGFFHRVLKYLLASQLSIHSRIVQSLLLFRYSLTFSDYFTTQPKMYLFLLWFAETKTKVVAWKSREPAWISEKQWVWEFGRLAESREVLLIISSFVSRFSTLVQSFISDESLFDKTEVINEAKQSTGQWVHATLRSLLSILPAFNRFSMLLVTN